MEPWNSARLRAGRRQEYSAFGSCTLAHTNSKLESTLVCYRQADDELAASWTHAGERAIEARARDAMAACTVESRLPGHRQRAAADADAHAMRCSAEQSRTLDRIGQAKQGRQIWREGGGGERV